MTSMTDAEIAEDLRRQWEAVPNGVTVNGVAADWLAVAAYARDVFGPSPAERANAAAPAPRSDAPRPDLLPEEQAVIEAALEWFVEPPDDAVPAIRYKRLGECARALRAARKQPNPVGALTAARKILGQTPEEREACDALVAWKKWLGPDIGKWSDLPEVVRLDAAADALIAARTPPDPVAELVKQAEHAADMLRTNNCRIGASLLDTAIAAVKAQRIRP